MEKINICEILKDCPIGMELDCTMFKDVYFDCVEQENDIIKCYIQNNDYKISISFTKYGCYTGHEKSKCVIFPKGKTTWEGFQKPFKDGDVVFVTKYPKETWIGIFKQYNKTSFESHCSLSTIGDFCSEGFKNHILIGLRLATEEEKQKLFDAIKANGYKWNAEIKTLEKLIEPKFKVGDRVKKNKDYISGIVTDIFDDSFKVTYKGGSCSYVQFHYQHEWELVPNKFDISTLKPFDKVLVRCNSLEKWHIQFFEKYNTELDAKYPFICLCNSKYCQCIPYEGNEHLLDTINDCDEYYKNW